MNLTYKTIDNMPDEYTLLDIVMLHESVFGTSDDLAGRMKEKSSLSVILALDGERAVGYKIGYALNREQYYSWLGGVHKDYRGHGIAARLMGMQHQHIQIHHYKAIQTHTKNKWRNMLI